MESWLGLEAGIGLVLEVEVGWGLMLGFELEIVLGLILRFRYKNWVWV